jgi:hypothetical protein
MSSKGIKAGSKLLVQVRSPLRAIQMAKLRPKAKLLV